MASIQPRKNKQGEIVSYQIKVTRGRDVLTKKQLTPYTMTFTPPATWDTWSRKAKEKELQRVSSEFEAACKRGEVLTKEEELQAAIREQKEPTFSAYSVDYLNSVKVSKSINTQSKYKWVCDEASKTFGQIKMKDITPLIIKNFLTDIQNNRKNQKTGKPVTLGTVRGFYKSLHILFETAVDDGVIQFSPMQRMKEPKPRTDEEIKEPISYTEDEVIYILDCLKKEPLMWQAAIMFLIDSGCRNGETIALKWDAINMDTGEVTISLNAQTTTGHGTYLTTPKSKRKRSIFLNDDAVKILKRWKHEQVKELFETGNRNKGNWVFTRDNGEMLSTTAIREYLHRFGKKYNLPGIHPHAMRHTMASISITNGADVVTVSKKLGHSSPAITLNIYAHSNDEAQKKANNALASAIYQKAGNQ